MSIDQWDDRNQWLNRLSSEFYRKTYGQITNITFEATPDDIVLVSGDAQSYYGVQLALLAIQHCRRDRFPFRSIRLSLTIGNQSLDIAIAPRDVPHNLPASKPAGCRSQLPLAAFQ